MNRYLETQLVDFSKLIEATASTEEALSQQTLFWQLFWKNVKLLPIELREEFELYVRGSCIAELIDYIEGKEKKLEITQVLTLFASQFVKKPHIPECNLARFFELTYDQTNPIPNIDLYFLAQDRKRLGIMFAIIESILSEIDSATTGLFSYSIEFVRPGRRQEATIALYKVKLSKMPDREINIICKIKSSQPDTVSTRSPRQQSILAPLRGITENDSPTQLDITQTINAYFTQDSIDESSLAVNKALMTAQTIRFNVLHLLHNTIGLDQHAFEISKYNILNHLRLESDWQRMGKYVHELVVAFCHEPEIMSKIIAELGTEVFPNFNQPILSPESSLADLILSIHKARDLEELLERFEGPAIENTTALKWLKDTMDKWNTVFYAQTSPDQQKFFGDPRLLIFLFLALVPKDLHPFKP